MPDNVCFVDTETISLDPDVEPTPIWEVALITPDDREHVWQFPVDEMKADPFALNIGAWWDRHWNELHSVSQANAIYEAHSPKSRLPNSPETGSLVKPNREWCEYFRNLVGTNHLAGAVVSFDEERLRRLLRRNGVLPRWHYHVVCVEALAAGWLAGHPPTFEAVQADYRPPWDSEALSRAVGVDPKDFDRHSALGDARWAKAVFEAVMGE